MTVRLLSAAHDGWLGLLLGDLASAVGCEVAVVCGCGPGGQLQIMSALGGAGVVAAARGGGARPGGGREPGGSFVGRALTSERAVIEALDPNRDASLIHASPAMALTHAASAPVRVPGGVSGRLIAGFARRPQDPVLALWTVESYAAVVALCVQHPAALEGLQHARQDGLTGCLTYGRTLHELTREINRCTRDGQSLSCCFIDLDDFKRINDRRGHVHGNHVLAEVAHVLRDGVRSCDTVGRYGGDEFIAILPQTSEDEGWLLAERLRARIATARISSFDGPLSASVGVAAWTPGTTAEQLLTRADSALLAAKALRARAATASQAAKAATDALSGCEGGTHARPAVSPAMRTVHR